MKRIVIRDRGPGKYQQGKAQPVKAHPEKGKKIKSSNFFNFFLAGRAAPKEFVERS